MAVGFAVVLLLVSAPGAWAAPPANDNFADAEDLGAGFPVVTETWSNVDATEEVGEPYDVFTAGHSVWFRWEATSDDVVTIDTCQSEFATSLVVFTGASPDALTKVGEDGLTNGRNCPAAGGVTFRPVAGTTYSIMVDGDAFYLPEGKPPLTKGSFELKVEKTPQPPNDDFDQAMPLAASVTAMSPGDFFQIAWADSYNWEATKEAGEPSHGGDLGGASAWYTWTAPVSGRADLSACSSFDFRLGVYRGNSVNALVPVAVESRPAPCSLYFPAVAGTMYRIAVDGRFDPGAGRPKMGSHRVEVTIGSKSQAPAANPSVEPDTKPPNTRISKRVFRRMPPTWIFSFSSNEPGSTFECKLDKRPFKKCRSSKTFKRPRPGRHALRVRAIDPSGNVDLSPAVAHFEVEPSPPRRGRR
ncbi:MAG: hypothetical protein ABW196_07860 [Solirubrobacterales bacterium]